MIRHPCVAGCVPNDYAPGRNGLLLTGGNMAGKSTFIKAVAVNVLLAQSLDVAFARRYEGPPLRVISALGAETTSSPAGAPIAARRRRPCAWVFDYRLRRGESTVGNAIATLKRLGYPRSIVDAAAARIGHI